MLVSNHAERLQYPSRLNPNQYIAPLFEIASILSQRGHIIHFGTLGGRESWADGKPFISRVHILGPAICNDVEQMAYEDMSKWPTNLTSG
jgi:hypothetical protein